jgi:DNA-binding response OmpR family regulator
MNNSKVLIQETDQSVLDVLSIALEDEGFCVLGKLGFDAGFMGAIDKFRPHVVVLDYRLSGVESVRVCREIKKKYPQLPVLALSCNSNIHLEYNERGFDDYIRKPFDLGVLYKILRKHVARAQNAY